MKRILLLLAWSFACKSGPAPTPAAAPAPPAPPPASAYKALVDAPDRSEADRKLDPGRKPVEMLEFLAVKPGMKVEDLGAGTGYTTELLVRAVGPSGVVYMQNDPRWLPFLKDALAERSTHPAMKAVVRAEVPFDDPVPPEAKDLDLVVMNVIYHDIANMPVDRVRMNQIIFNALRPGGAYVVIDSSAKDGSGLSATQSLHRIDPEVVKEEVQKAGFKLAGERSFLRNPDDARDWNASPGAATQLGKRGQSDRFALRFVRPEGSKAQLVPPRLRLPPGARPTRVTAELTVDPQKDELSGVEEIELSVEKPLPGLRKGGGRAVLLDQGGLPLVTVKVACDSGKGRVELSQSRFVPLGAAQNPPPPQSWQIPVCLRTDRGRTCTLLAEKTGAVDLEACPRWVMPNAGASGYYRAALEGEQTRRLTSSVASLTVPERMMFFSDVVAAAQAGEMEYSRAFELAGALAGDRSRHVVESLVPAVAFARSRSFFPDELLPQYAGYVRETFGPRARALGFAEKRGEPEDARILRPELLELVGEDGQIRTEGRKVAERWLRDHRSTSPELASAALRLAAVGGDAGFYQTLHAAAKAEKDRLERQRILGAMGEFRDPALVQRGFGIAISDEFDPRESITLIWRPSHQPRTREAALRFVQENFDAIVARMPRDYGAVLPGIAESFCDPEHQEVLEGFFRPRARKFPGGDRHYAQTLEKVRQCAAFRAKAGPALAAWLSRREAAPPRHAGRVPAN